MASFYKVTHGHVVQCFNEQGECLWQKFVSDDVTFEKEDEDIYTVIEQKDMPFGGNEYFPFDMVQPS